MRSLATVVVAVLTVSCGSDPASKPISEAPRTTDVATKFAKEKHGSKVETATSPAIPFEARITLTTDVESKVLGPVNTCWTYGADTQLCSYDEYGLDDFHGVTLSGTYLEIANDRSSEWTSVFTIVSPKFSGCTLYRAESGRYFPPAPGETFEIRYDIKGQSLAGPAHLFGSFLWVVGAAGDLETC